MKFIKLVFIVLAACGYQKAYAFEPSEHMHLASCYEGGISEQIECIEEELKVCNEFAVGLTTADGAYGCYYELFNQTDAYLNDRYQSSIERARDADIRDTYLSREASLRSAQRKWIVYRDEMCRILPDWHRIGPGAGAPFDQCKAHLSLIQAKFLDDWAR